VKRIILVIFSVLLVSAFIFSGCAQPATTPITPTAPGEEVKPIEWTFVSFMPPFDIFATEPEEWGQRLTEATGGRMKITFYWAESLVKLTGLLDAADAGTADIALHPLAPYPQRLSLAWVGGLPGIFESSAQSGQAMVALLNKYKEMRDQFLPCRVIWADAPGPFELTSKVPVRTMEDLKGLKISTGLKYEELSYTALGASPLYVHPTEAYQALETGVIDASCLDFNGIFIWKLHEASKYRVGNTLGMMSFMAASMNIDSYNRLPADIKQKFDELTDPMARTKVSNEAFAKFWAESVQGIKEYDKKVGNPEFYYLPAEEHDRWVKTAWPAANEEWVREEAAKGYPAQAMLDDLVALAAQYK
jgi:TRAP-type C4-dicarboxylate transport system substrate-binding protein